MAEKVLHPEDDLYVNYDLWKSGTRKVLFVTGLSGSGKSTLTRYISSKYGGAEGKCVYVPLDIFFQISYYALMVKGPNPNNPGVSNFLIDFARAYGYGDVDSEDPTWFIASSKMKNTPYSIKIKDIVEFVSLQKSDIRLILEGVQIFDVQDLQDTFLQYPMVIKSVPTFQALSRALKRNYDAPLFPAAIKDFFANGGGTISWYLRSRKRLDALLDQIYRTIDASKIQKMKSYQAPM